MILDFAGCRLRIRVIPGCIRIFLIPILQRIVASLPLPGTTRGCRTWTEIFPLQRSFWEVSIPFHGFVSIAFGNHSAVPDCFGHNVFGVHSRYLFRLTERGACAPPSLFAPTLTINLETGFESPGRPDSYSGITDTPVTCTLLAAASAVAVIVTCFP